MGFGVSKEGPDVPEAQETAGFQTGTNIGTTKLTNKDYTGSVSPYGTVSYDKTGDKVKYTDPYTGETYKVPQYNETYTLSPTEQAKYDASGQATNLATSRLGELSSPLTLGAFDFGKEIAPLDLSVGATEERLNELGRSFLDPRFAQEEATTEADLLSKGIRQGSAAYTSAQQDLGDEKTRAYNDLLLSGHEQAASDLTAEWNALETDRERQLAERTQQTGEAFGLRDQASEDIGNLYGWGTSLSQNVNLPTPASEQPSAYPITDVAGLINQQFSDELDVWKQQMETMGSKGGAGLGFLGDIIASDERIKDDMKVVGKTAEGLPIYEFRIGDGPMQTGVSAQDVEKVDPSLVSTTEEGIKAVDYGQIDTDGTYTVRKNDNLWKIGERLGVDPREIIAANPDLAQNPDYILPGQKLMIPGMAAPGPASIPVVDGRLKQPPGNLPATAPPAPPPIGGMGMPTPNAAAVAAALTGDPRMPSPMPGDPRAAAAAPPDPSIWAGKFTSPAPVPVAPSAEGRTSEVDQFADQGLGPRGEPRASLPPEVLLKLLLGGVQPTSATRGY